MPNKDEVCHGCEQYEKGLGCPFFNHSVQVCKELTSCNYMDVMAEERLGNKAW